LAGNKKESKQEEEEEDDGGTERCAVSSLLSFDMTDARQGKASLCVNWIRYNFLPSQAKPKG
jgi:hypothetical protein